MAVITCSICGNTVSQGIDIDICSRCIINGTDHNKLLAIRKFLEKYPDSTYKQVSLMLHISTADINRFIEQGSLLLIKKDNGKSVINIDSKSDQNKPDRRSELIKKLLVSPTPINSNKTKFNNDSRLVNDLKEKFFNEK